VDLEKIVDFVNLLTEKEIRIVCAESITGGLLASSIVSIPGASAVLLGSIVTYDKDFKIKVLGVNGDTISANTAESFEVTEEMVKGAINLFPSAELYVAVTGVASIPVNEYSITKEVGEIFIVVNYKNQYFKHSEIIKEEERNLIRMSTVESIFDFITNILTKDH
jgi:nicotinamide-nucleotide amidase